MLCGSSVCSRVGHRPEEHKRYRNVSSVGDQPPRPSARECSSGRAKALADRSEPVSRGPNKRDNLAQHSRMTRHVGPRGGDLGGWKLIRRSLFPYYERRQRKYANGVGGGGALQCELGLGPHRFA